MNGLTLMVLIMGLLYSFGSDVAMYGLYVKNFSIKRITVRLLFFTLTVALIIAKIY